MSSRRIRTTSNVLWIAAAFVWGGVSLLILIEYRLLGGEPRQLRELWFLMSLLWAQLGFAALFADWRRNRGRRFRTLLLRTLLPPLVLHFVIFGLI
jgi:hypothetical protein